MLGLKKKRITHPKRGVKLTMMHSKMKCELVDKRTVTAFQTRAFRVECNGRIHKVVPNQIEEMRADYEDEKE